MRTRRESIIKLLREHDDITLQELADLTQTAVKTIARDLDSVRKTIKSEGLRIEVRPAKCMACEYLFTGRNRVSDPTKCPECHSERIDPQRFRLAETKQRE
ncbi:MAG: DeoR family transcriptional regulator [Candidatus Heimdallarchaeota archaeon]|nr:DeoR family transcriptional regulator [Candidatus Heimdallarchaeota archaeon]